MLDKCLKIKKKCWDGSSGFSFHSGNCNIVLELFDSLLYFKKIFQKSFHWWLTFLSFLCFIRFQVNNTLLHPDIVEWWEIFWPVNINLQSVLSVRLSDGCSNHSASVRSSYVCSQNQRLVSESGCSNRHWAPLVVFILSPADKWTPSERHEVFLDTNSWESDFI